MRNEKGFITFELVVHAGMVMIAILAVVSYILDIKNDSVSSTQTSVTVTTQATPVAEVPPGQVAEQVVATLPTTVPTTQIRVMGPKAEIRSVFMFEFDGQRCLILMATGEFSWNPSGITCWPIQ